MQGHHRIICDNEQCIVAFQIHGLLNHQTRARERRCHQPQAEAASKKEDGNEPNTKKAKRDILFVLGHVVATIPSGNVASETKAGTLQKDGLNIHTAGFVPGSAERGAGEVVRPMLPCNFSEEEDWYELHDGYQAYQRNDEEATAWQHHLNNCIDDQLMADVAQNAVEEAKTRARENGNDVPEIYQG